MKKAGFTLIEISIVLLIIGLLIGGTLVGESLIRTSQLNAVISEVTQFQQGFKDFQARYNALPGDMVNATDSWGAEAACPATIYTASPHILTCNGDGDGQIGAASGSYYELFRAWQQLSNAAMIKGSFNGIKGSGASGYESLPGINVPKAKLDSGAYSLFNTLATLPGTNWPLTGHVLVLGSALTNDITRMAALRPSEALALDTKIDDGLPGYGKVVTQRVVNCITDVNDATLSKYNATNNGIFCNLVFTMGF